MRINVDKTKNLINSYTSFQSYYTLSLESHYSIILEKILAFCLMNNALFRILVFLLQNIEIILLFYLFYIRNCHHWSFKMSTKLPGYDETVTCPYNKCHIILRSRIQTHLIKCARSHPDIKLEVCPFDVTHRFKTEDKKVIFK